MHSTAQHSTALLPLHISPCITYPTQPQSHNTSLITQHIASHPSPRDPTRLARIYWPTDTLPSTGVRACFRASVRASA